MSAQPHTEAAFETVIEAHLAPYRQIALTWLRLAAGQTLLGVNGDIRFDLADTVCRIAACAGLGQPATLSHSRDASQGVVQAGGVARGSNRRADPR